MARAACCSPALRGLADTVGEGGVDDAGALAMGVDDRCVDVSSAGVGMMVRADGQSTGRQRV